MPDFYDPWEHLPSHHVIKTFKKEVPVTNVSRATKARDGFLFGADPELFVCNEKGEFVSAEGLIPGTKEEPHVVENGAIQVDGFAAEFNIDPASSWQEFDGNITSVLEQLKAMLPKGYTLSGKASVRFDEAIFDAAPPKSKELGCSPDIDAWTGGFNSPPNINRDPYLRCAGGHLHIGWTKDGDVYDLQHILNCQDMVKQLDWYLGAWSLSQDPDTERRSLYGKAGACRYKEYGVEYRTLSNFWVLDRKLRLAVWNRMQRAIEMMAKQFMPDYAEKSYSELLRKSINNSQLDYNLAQVFPTPIASIPAPRSGYVEVAL